MIDFKPLRSFHLTTHCLRKDPAPRSWRTLWSNYGTFEICRGKAFNMQLLEPYYLHTLKEALSKRQRQNPSYSMRAFAKYLEMDSSNLSGILHRKRGLPANRAAAIARKLKLTPRESALFASSCIKKQMRLDAIKVHDDAKNYLLDEKYHQVISEWEYYAFLQLLKLKNFSPDYSWAAKRLGLKEIRVRQVVENLLELGFIKADSRKGFIRLSPSLETSEDVESQALQAAHSESLELAKKKLDLVPVEQRDFSSITLPINPEKMAEAKAIIREFQEKLHTLLTTGEQKEVYQFNCQLFPLTNIGVTE